MTTIIRDDDSRMAKVDGAGFIVRSHDDRLICVTLTEDQRKAMAAAMDPDRATGGQWTRADLPAVFDHSGTRADIVAWLNAHHPKPVPYDQGGWPEGWQTVANMEARAVTAEHARDAAVERVARRDEEIDLIARQCAEARAERDAAVARAEQAESERDGWRENAEHRSTIIEQLRARAEKAEELAAQRAETVRRLRDAHSNLIARHRRLTDQSDEPASAVSRADIEKALRSCVVMRRWLDNAELVEVPYAIDAVCDLLGIEAEQAVDPVEELAEQIESATRKAIRETCSALASVAPGLDPVAVERAMEVTAASRSLAAHVLGQEADQ